MGWGFAGVVLDLLFTRESYTPEYTVNVRQVQIVSVPSWFSVFRLVSTKLLELLLELWLELDGSAVVG